MAPVLDHENQTGDPGRMVRAMSAVLPGVLLDEGHQSSKSSRISPITVSATRGH